MREPIVGRIRFTSVERTREAIVEATLMLLQEDGFAATTISRIAANAGVSKATIYANWSSKSELVAEIIARFAPPADAVPDTGDLRADLRASIANILQIAQSVRGIIEGIVAAAATDELLADHLRQLVGLWRSHQRHLFQRAVQASGRSSLVDERVAIDLPAAVIWFRLSLCDGEGIADLPEQLVDPVLRAWGVNPDLAGRPSPEGDDSALDAGSRR